MVQTLVCLITKNPSNKFTGSVRILLPFSFGYGHTDRKYHCLQIRAVRVVKCFLLNLSELFRWFHKNLSSAETIKLLSTKPHGTFLFRASSSPGINSQRLLLTYFCTQDCIVLSMVSGKDVLHARISVTLERGFKFEDKTYPNLRALVESRYADVVALLLKDP